MWTSTAQNGLWSSNQTEDQKAEDFRGEMPLLTKLFHSAHSAMSLGVPLSDQGP
jgi:hypothetical protein